MEIIIVIGIISIAIFSLYELVLSSRSLTSRELRHTQALSLAEEGLEAVRNIRDQGWTTNIASLNTSATYYLSLSGSAWGLTTTNPGTIDGIFTRTITIASVNRDSNSNISASGTSDPNTRKVTSTVTWTDRGRARSVVVTTYITNFQEN